MKKTTIYLVLMLMAMSAIAQEKMPVIYPENRTLPEAVRTGRAVRMPKMAEVANTEAEIEVSESVIPHISKTIKGNAVAHKAPAAVENTVGYLNPAGTLFCGVEEAGKGAFFKTGAIIGAWSCDLPCWKWTNTATGDISSITYTTQLSGQYPSYAEDALYSVDKDYNFYDSIVARGGWQEAYAMGENGDAGYLWQYSVPLQTVKYKDKSEKKYAMLNKSFMPSYSNLAIAAGGLPSGQTADGLWPLTNAVNITKEGVQFDLIADTDPDGYVHYFYGSDSVNTESGRTAPVKLTTHYDKPQRMLYVKNITLALGANGYTAFKKDTMKVNELHVTVKDAKGNTIAEADATSENLSTMTSPKAGQLLTFSFREVSTYGELLHEGFTVNSEFSVEITGFSATDHFGIYSAKSSLYESKSEMLYEDGKVRTIAYDPYIMLNGIYPTLETYTGVAVHQNDPIQYPTYRDAMKYAYDSNGDTIYIKFEESDGAGRYQYIASNARGEAKGQTEFDLYSTFKPYDENHYWLMDIERPEYVLMSADYETNIGSDDDPITIWDYYRLFTLFIYATDKPSIGDEIKIGKAGRNMVFKVVEVGEASNNDETVREPKAQKKLQNSSIVIDKDGVLFNIYGVRIQ